jgi:hypothetical protein
MVRRRLAAGLADLRNDVVGRRFGFRFAGHTDAQIVDHHGGAMCRHRLGHPLADSPPGSGYCSDFAIQNTHVIFSTFKKLNSQTSSPLARSLSICGS